MTMTANQLQAISALEAYGYRREGEAWVLRNPRGNIVSHRWIPAEDADGFLRFDVVDGQNTQVAWTARPEVGAQADGTNPTTHPGLYDWVHPSEFLIRTYSPQE